jgi:hypothetical protein
MTNLVPGTKLYIYDKFGAWHQICHLVFSILLTSPTRDYMLYTLHCPLFFSLQDTIHEIRDTNCRLYECRFAKSGECII